MVKVSVIIPNYNHAKFLEQRISSVLEQSFQDFEVIIMDDCSTDDSIEIIEKFKNHPKISKLIYNDVNSGSTFKQWEKGLKFAKGSLIWIAESDDYCNKEFLNKLVPKFSPNTNIVYCQSFKTNRDDNVKGSWYSWTKDLKGGEIFNNNFVINGVEYIKKFLIFKNTIPNASAVLFRKTAYIEVGGVTEDIKTNNDWLLWLKMLCLGDISYVAEPLNYFRYHENSVIAMTRKNANNEFLGIYCIVLRTFFEKFIKNLKGEGMAEILKINRRLTIYDVSNESIFLFKKRMILKALKNLLKTVSLDITVIGHFYKLTIHYISNNLSKPSDRKV